MSDNNRSYSTYPSNIKVYKFKSVIGRGAFGLVRIDYLGMGGYCYNRTSYK